MLLDEKLYFFNPFALKRVTTEAISEQLDEFGQSFHKDADTPMDIAYNIELGTNCLYLYGELLARCSSAYDKQHYENEMNEALEVQRLRKEWSDTKTEKAPAIKYFEAEAMKKYQIPRNREFDLDADYKRIKAAYDSMESKTNAWKKKLDAIKYEIGVQ